MATIESEQDCPYEQMYLKRLPLKEKIYNMFVLILNFPFTIFNSIIELIKRLHVKCTKPKKSSNNIMQI